MDFSRKLFLFRMNFIVSILNNPQRRRFWLSLALVAAALAYISFSDFGVLRRARLSAKQSELKASIETERLRSDSLRSRIKALRADTTEIERIAREKYGMIKPGEKVYIYSKEQK